jgi:hypothetical protein
MQDIIYSVQCAFDTLVAVHRELCIHEASAVAMAKAELVFEIQVCALYWLYIGTILALY